MTILEIPFFYDVEYVPRGARKPRETMVRDQMLVDVPEYGASEMDHTDLVVRLEYPGGGYHDRKIASEIYRYMRGRDGGLLAPWHGPTSYWFSGDMSVSRAYSPALAEEALRDLSEKAGNQARHGVSAKLVWTWQERLLREPELNAREVVASTREKIERDATSYWSKACFVDGRLFVPTPGPVRTVHEDMTTLVDDIALASPSTLWVCSIAESGNGAVVNEIREEHARRRGCAIGNRSLGEVLSLDPDVETPDGVWATVRALCVTLHEHLRGNAIERCTEEQLAAFYPLQRLLKDGPAPYEAASDREVVEAVEVLDQAIRAGDREVSHLRVMLDHLEPRVAPARAREATRINEQEFEIDAVGLGHSMSM